MTPEQWSDVLAVNLVGPNLTIAAALARLSEHGMVAVVSSDSSAEPRHSLVPYGCSQAALEAATEGWRTEEGGGRRFVTIVLGPMRPSDFSRDLDEDEFANPGFGYDTLLLRAPEVGDRASVGRSMFVDTPPVEC